MSNINISFHLEKYSGSQSRYTCPSCGHKHEFTRYVNNQSGDYVSDDVGICNRKSNCGYHKSPRQYFEEQKIFGNNSIRIVKSRPKLKCENQQSLIDPILAQKSLTNYFKNNLCKYISRLIGEESTLKVFGKYMVGTSKYWKGATVFWQQDIKGSYRTGKIMLYNDGTGKRVKVPFNHIQWVHKVMKMPNFELRQCLFGEHLLIEETKPINLVESEKTAIIACHYMPEYTWLATGGFGNFSEELCKVLKGRVVNLFPDAGCLSKWKAKAKLIQKTVSCRFDVNEIVEDRYQSGKLMLGADIADMLVK